MTYWEELDALVSQWQSRQRAPEQTELKLAPAKAPRTELTTVELMLIEKLQRSVTFPPGSSHKRFIRGLDQHSQLSEAGRCYLAYIAHRYRKQWQANDDEFQWMVRWKHY